METRRNQPSAEDVDGGKRRAQCGETKQAPPHIKREVPIIRQDERVCQGEPGINEALARIGAIVSWRGIQEELGHFSIRRNSLVGAAVEIPRILPRAW